MNPYQLNKPELAELAAPSGRPIPLRRQFMIAGGVIGVLAPCLLSLISNERAWDEYADYYGPGYHRLLGLLTEFPIPAFLSGIAGSAAGYFLWLAICSHHGFQSRTLAGGVVAGAVHRSKT